MIMLISQGDFNCTCCRNVSTFLNSMKEKRKIFFFFSFFFSFRGILIYQAANVEPRMKPVNVFMHVIERCHGCKREVLFEKDFALKASLESIQCLYQQKFPTSIILFEIIFLLSLPDSSVMRTTLKVFF